VGKGEEFQGFVRERDILREVKCNKEEYRENLKKITTKSTQEGETKDDKGK
jgi:hypothetical protein